MVVTKVASKSYLNEKIKVSPDKHAACGVSPASSITGAENNKYLRVIILPP